MKLPTDEQLEMLSRAELIGLVKELISAVQQLQVRVAELEAEVTKHRQPPPTSRNSSQPPSLDYKANLPGRRRKRRGAKPGHERAIRELVDDPDQVIEACQCDLRLVEPRAVVRRQVTELPEISPLVIETRQHEVVCPGCQSLQRGELPAGLEPTRYFGPRLEATIIYLKHEQHLSFERLREVCAELFGVEISEGGLSAILERAGAAAQPMAQQIGQAVRQSAIIQSDETSARVRGRNWWQWVFSSAAGVYHLIRPSRGGLVIAEFMGERRSECWVCDCFSAQLTAPSENFQLCLAHQLRDLERLLEARPQLAWATEMRSLFGEAIHLWKRFDELTLDGFLRRSAELENRLERLLKRPLSGGDAQRLRQRFWDHREHLLTFLHYPGVPPTNNACERALRPSVIHRKVTNGFRSEWGAHAYAALQTIIATARLNGQRVFDELVKLCGTPVLHFLTTQDP
jgi:transposase